jgi:hypothetical protein
MKNILSISLIAIAGITMSSAALSGGIPQSFPAHTTGIGNMPSQASGNQPSFPPSRAVGGQGGAQPPSFPSMPSQSTQGTSRIPSGPGRDGFNNRGNRRP